MLRTLRVGPRLALGFGLIISLFIGLSAFTLTQVQEMADQTEHVSSHLLDEREMALNWAAEVEKNLLRTEVVLQTTDTAVVKKLTADMKATSQNIDKLQEQAKAMLVNGREAEVFSKVLEARQQYVAVRKQAMALKDASDPAVIAVLETKVKPAAAQYQAAIDDVVKIVHEAAATTTASAKASADRTLWTLATVAALIVLAAAVLGWRIQRSLTQPLRAVGNALARVATGDLTARVNDAGRDEVAQLAQQLNTSTQSMSSVLADVLAGSDSVRVASQQIATGNMDLSSRTENQASSLQQSAAAVEELTATTQTNANVSSEATSTALAARDASATAGQTVESVVSSMDRISESSRKIGEIVGLIDNIAFQTNILALNAAVEAARAGEQGRGFAVVASEVRSLAQRSAAAAREVKTIVTATLEHIETGASEAQRAGAAMEGVTRSVESVKALVEQMAHATQEQARGLQEINGAVNALDQATQQNAALVEESAAAADSLREQAERLHGAVERFRIA